MRCERFARFLNRFHQCAAELFIPEMFAHSANEPLPESFAAFLVDRLVADHREFVRTRRDKNQDRISLRRFVHPEPMKFFLRSDQWIDIQLAALNKNANFTGRF